MAATTHSQSIPSTTAPKSAPFLNAPTPIALEPNCLYISTLPLTTAAFHWSIVYVDSAGACTWHQWASVSERDPAGREAYVRTALPPPGATSRTGGSVVLGYFRVSDLASSALLPAEDVFHAMCEGVFGESFDRAQENRAHGISCRTWITDVLAKLLTPDRAREIEQRVTARSRARSDEWATSFLFRRPFTCVVEDV